MDMREVAFHPLSSRFPVMSGSGLHALLADIGGRGQRRPIALFEGMIWDGRSRYFACRELGVESKFRILRAAHDPIPYLIQRHSDRYGEPNSPERLAALAILQEIYEPEWKAAAAKRRSDWIAGARNEFRAILVEPQACEVCGIDRRYAHAHHRLPLNVQFDLGLNIADHAHDWLCQVHHGYVHKMISVYVTATAEGSFLDHIPDRLHDEWSRVETVFARGYDLWQRYGGINHNGLGADPVYYDP